MLVRIYPPLSMDFENAVALRVNEDKTKTAKVMNLLTDWCGAYYYPPPWICFTENQRRSNDRLLCPDKSRGVFQKRCSCCKITTAGRIRR